MAKYCPNTCLNTCNQNNDINNLLHVVKHVTCYLRHPPTTIISDCKKASRSKGAQRQ